MEFSSQTYFPIRFAQTKIALFISFNNWESKEDESFLIVRPCLRVICHVIYIYKVTIFIS